MPSTDDRILSALATGPRTARELAVLADLGDWRDALDPIAHLARAGLVTRGRPRPGRRNPGGMTLTYQLTRAGEAAALDLAADPVAEPLPRARPDVWHQDANTGAARPDPRGNDLTRAAFPEDHAHQDAGNETHSNRQQPHDGIETRPARETAAATLF